MWSGDLQTIYPLGGLAVIALLAHIYNGEYSISPHTTQLLPLLTRLLNKWPLGVRDFVKHAIYAAVSYRYVLVSQLMTGFDLLAGLLHATLPPLSTNVSHFVVSVYFNKIYFRVLLTCFIGVAFNALYQNPFFVKSLPPKLSGNFIRNHGKI